MTFVAKNINRPVLRRPAVRWLLMAIIIMSLSAASLAQIAVGISVRIGPPALPVYAQPICPGPGYIWTPGYWAWNDDAGYYWVPGTWVVAPVGLLWTPGYWGFAGGFYGWHAGYWGPHIGFYGGVNYGFGYGGVGFAGGEWRGGSFYYNRSVTNVSVTNVTNVYNKTVVVNNTTVNNVSYNGGAGGIKAEPTAQEKVAMNEHHTAPVAAQTQHEHAASQNKANFASENHGKPAVAATAKPGDFSAKSAVPARSAGGEYKTPTMSPKEARASTPAANKPSTKAANKASTSAGNKPFNPPTKTTNSTPAVKNTSTTSSNRPFNPPAKSTNSANANSAGGNQNHSNTARNESKPAPQPASHPQSTPRPAAQSRPAPQPKPTPQSKPAQSRPAPPPQHSSPPKNEHRGR